jgi:hypothetical protein
MPIAMFQQLILSTYKLSFMACLALGSVRFTWSLWQAFQKDWAYLRRLHQIPCSRCNFFTSNYNLKCTVHPAKALNEAAIGCLDYQPHKSS